MKPASTNVCTVPSVAYEIKDNIQAQDRDGCSWVAYNMSEDTVTERHWQDGYSKEELQASHTCLVPGVDRHQCGVLNFPSLGKTRRVPGFILVNDYLHQYYKTSLPG